MMSISDLEDHKQRVLGDMKDVEKSRIYVLASLDKEKDKVLYNFYKNINKEKVTSEYIKECSDLAILNELTLFYISDDMLIAECHERIIEIIRGDKGINELSDNEKYFDVLLDALSFYHEARDYMYDYHGRLEIVRSLVELISFNYECCILKEDLDGLKAIREKCLFCHDSTIESLMNLGNTLVYSIKSKIEKPQDVISYTLTLLHFAIIKLGWLKLIN